MLQNKKSGLYRTDIIVCRTYSKNVFVNFFVRTEVTLKLSENSYKHREYKNLHVQIVRQQINHLSKVLPRNLDGGWRVPRGSEGSLVTNCRPLCRPLGPRVTLPFCSFGVSLSKDLFLRTDTYGEVEVGSMCEGPTRLTQL